MTTASLGSWFSLVSSVQVRKERMLMGCTIESRRPTVVQARYVPTCPRGYHYDGHDCRENRPPEREVIVEVHH
jgi:hypothetical protein